MSFKLDTSKFKKVGGDKNHTILQHADGHQLKIAHKSLSPKARGQLAELDKAHMAKGGDPTQEHLLPGDKDQNKIEKQVVGKAKKYADGGPVAADSDNQKAILKEQYPKKKVHNFDGGGGVPGGPGSPAIDDTAAKKSDDYYKTHPHESAGEMWSNLKKGFGLSSDEDKAKSPAPKNYADGGEASNSPPEIDKKKAEDFQKGFNNPDPIVRAVKSAFGMADGGPVKNLDLNQDSSSEDQAAPQAPQQAPVVINVGGQQPAPQQQPAPEGNIVRPDKLMAAMMDQNSTQQLPTAQDPYQAFQQVGQAAGASPMQMSTPMHPQDPEASDVPSPTSQGGGPAPQGIAPQGAAPAAQGNDLLNGSVLADQNEALKQQIAGIQNEAKAQGALAQDQSRLLENKASLIQEYGTQYEKTLGDMNKLHDQITEAYKTGDIDPNRYWEQKSTGGKIATIIGLILGGGGAALAGQENLAAKMLNANIDRDIDAQKANFNKKNTLLKMNMDQLHDQQSAIMATKAIQMDNIATQMEQAAAKQGGPLAAARAQQAIAPIKLQAASLRQQAAMRSALMGVQNNANKNPDQIPAMINMIGNFDPEKAKDLRERFVPSIGIASEKVPDAVRDKIIAHKQLDDAARDLQGWVKTHSTLLPGTEDYNIGAQKAQVLQQLIRHGQLQTVYREGEQPLLDKMVNSNPAGFMKAFSTQPKLKELIQSNVRQFNQLKSGYGLPADDTANRLNAQQQQYLDWAKQNPTNPKAKFILQKLNVQ